MESFNPVQRLLEIIIQARSISSSNSGISSFDGWKMVFGLTNDKEVLPALNMLINLISEVKELSDKRLDVIEKQNFLDHINPLMGIPDLRSLSNPWENTTRQFTDRIISGLRFMSMMVKQEYCENRLEEDALKKWQMELDDIFKDINDDDTISYNLKQIILTQLNNITFAIRMYKVSGEKGIANISFSSVGIINFISTTKKMNKNEAFNKFKRITAVIICSLTIFSQISEISGYSVKELIQDLNNDDSTNSTTQTTPQDTNE